MNLTIDGNGSVIEWDNERGEHILFPLTEVGGKRRGCSHICFPFGIADEDFPQDTPQHGLIRQGNGCRAKQIDELHTTDSGDNTYEQVCRDMGGFQYLNGSITVRESVDGARATLSHNVRLDNISTSNTKSIPLSLGVHWYFAVHESNFVIRDEAGNHMDRDAVDMLHGEPYFWKFNDTNPVLTLKTSTGTVQVACHGGYDELVVWTDNSKHYVCIEPVVGRVRSNRRYLEPGKSFEANCVLTYSR